MLRLLARSGWGLGRPTIFFFIFPFCKASSCETLLKGTTKKFHIVDQQISCGRHFEVLNCIYNEDIGEK